jgi:hypothetical protein
MIFIRGQRRANTNPVVHCSGIRQHPGASMFLTLGAFSIEVTNNVVI